jgi:hypothetical protein
MGRVCAAAALWLPAALAVRRPAAAVLLVWLALAALNAGLLMRAVRGAPAGTEFVGTFYYVDDFYNYLSYVQQAEDGALLFRDKLGRPDQPARLLNLEWLSVGWMSALLGGRPLLAYRLFGLLLLLPMVALADRWLRRCGLPAAHRAAALLLVFTGGGLGGWRALAGTPLSQSLDFFTGLYPFVEALGNPHFVAGTTLFLAALDGLLGPRPWRGTLWAALLAFVRPYDALLLAGVRVGAVAASEPVRAWPRAWLPLLGLLPPVTYNAWLFFGSQDFGAFSSPVYKAFVPTPAALLWAALPAALCAIAAWPRGDVEPPARTARLHLLAWAVLALTFAASGLVSFGVQLLAGAGLPLLVLAAVGLARWPAAATLAALPLFAATSAAAVWHVARPSPYWHVPAVHVRTAVAPAQACRTGDTVLSPPDIGLYAGAFTACWPYVSHPAAPEFVARMELLRAFYESAEPAARAAALQRICPRHVVLPPAAAGVPEVFLGTASGYAPLSGPPRTLPLFTRPGPCPPP